MTEPEPFGLSELFSAAPARPSFDVRYRQGVILTWNPSTLENTIDVDGVPLVDLPVLGSAEAATFEVGDVVGLHLMLPDHRRGATWAIVGKFVIPNTADAFTALSFLSSTIYADEVDTLESSSSTSYTDLATLGPSVSDVLVGPSGRVLVTVSCTFEVQHVVGDLQPAIVYMSFVGNGPTTVNASDINSVSLGCNMQATVGNHVIVYGRFSKESLIDGLTAGLYSFTAKYRVFHASEVGLFAFRSIKVQAI